MVPHKVERHVETNIGGYASLSLRSAIPRFITIAVDQGRVSMVVQAKHDTLCIKDKESPAAVHLSAIKGIPILTADVELPVRPATRDIARIRIITGDTSIAKMLSRRV